MNAILSKRKLNKILIYRCGTLGDTIVSLPAINLIRDKYKDAELSLMTANYGDNKLWADTIFAEFGIFKEFITYKNSDYQYPWRLFKVIKKVSDLKPDIVIYFASEKISYYKIIRDKLFFRIAGIKLFYPIYTHYKKNFKSSDRNSHIYPKESVRFVSGLIDLGITDLKIRFDLPISNSIKLKIIQQLNNLGITDNDKLIALCPWSKMQAKRWPVERYIQLAEKLISDFGTKIMIVGGKVEADVVTPFLTNNLLIKNVFIFAGKLSILESSELISRCKLYVGNDTGPMHLASAVNVPSVAVFSARANPESWYPYGENNIVLRKDVDCQNCGLETCIKNKIKCLTEITIEEVYENCCTLLNVKGINN